MYPERKNKQDYGRTLSVTTPGIDNIFPDTVLCKYYFESHLQHKVEKKLRTSSQDSIVRS